MTKFYSMKIKIIIPFIICLIIPLIIGGISGFITSNEISTWFTTLKKPTFNPPNYLFGPVWTLLYILMGISLYMIWKSPKSKERKKALKVFSLQLFFNFWWSILFFSFHLLFVAVIDILLLWIYIVYMIKLFKEVKPLAAFINIPYLLWVSFATVLNISIWWLNK